MNDLKSTRQKWPTILASVSILYAVLYGLMYLRPTENPMHIASLWNMAIVASMFLGAVGLFIRKSWATPTLQFASWLAIAQAAYALVNICVFMGGFPPVFVVLGMLTAMLPGIAWPIFLLIWLSRNKLSIRIEEFEIGKAQPEDTLDKK